MAVREVTYAAIVIRIFASFLLGGIIGMKQQDAAIEEKVTKALAAKNS